MGVLRNLVLSGGVLIVFLAVSIGVLWSFISQPAPIPELEPTWWGPGAARKDDTTIKPFKINVSNEVLDDLHDRLELLPTLKPPLEGANFRYGFNTNYLKSVVEFWSQKYNWRDREAFLNKLPQFKTQVSGLNLHFIHAKPKEVPKGTKVLPLLLLHGWPGSIREFYGLIPLLTTPRKDANFVFEVIAPSLPGYGFSDGAAKQGLGAAQIAVVFKSLMERLGFQQFYLQGGDWGAIITANMATLYPKSILGLHSNMCFINTPLSNVKRLIGSLWPTLLVEEAHVDKMYPLSKTFSYLIEESGYMHLQASKPDTIGVALSDSPAGLAAYILEKFSTWTDPSWRSLPDGGLTKKFALVDLLDNIMIYWVSESITTSMRLYSETFNKAQLSLNMDSVPTPVPTACAVFPNELSYTPKCLLEEKFKNIVKFTHMERGGHFAAFEEPELLADDVFDAVKIMRSKLK
ncbi:juvenile hormone epoxide hydrolase 1 [Anabrus simplex]|uniref:juvenile hormone epoxide hydrolase 1 n=1 Tax=Anabrus simplex TaxID=316456 RepID=UPI0035A38B30